MEARNGTEMTNVTTYPGLLNFSLEYAKYHGYIAAIVCIWGFVANLANIVVLTRKNMYSSTNVLLMWLAVADLMTMTSYFPFSIHFYIMKDPDLSFPQTRSSSWLYFMLFHINFTVVMHTVAIWLTICLAIFRYIFIHYPTHSQDLCSISRAKLSVVAVYLSIAVVCVPNYLMYVPTTINNTVLNNSTQRPASAMYYDLDESPLATYSLQSLNYLIHTLLFKLVPCALLTILTILLIIAMHNAAKRRMKLKSQGKKDESDRAREHNRTTGMLVAIVALFLLTELPQGILTLCNFFIDDFYPNVYMRLGDLLDIAALLNNSINFVLYCTMSRQFRDTFMEVFCGCCQKKGPGWLKLKTFHIQSNGGGTAQV